MQEKGRAWTWARAGLVFGGLVFVSSGLVLASTIDGHSKDSGTVVLWLATGAADLVWAAMSIRRVTPVFVGAMLMLANLLSGILLIFIALGILLMLSAPSM